MMRRWMTLPVMLGAVVVAIAAGTGAYAMRDVAPFIGGDGKPDHAAGDDRPSDRNADDRAVGTSRAAICIEQATDCDDAVEGDDARGITCEEAHACAAPATHCPADAECRTKTGCPPEAGVCKDSLPICTDLAISACIPACPDAPAISACVPPCLYEGPITILPAPGEQTDPGIIEPDGGGGAGFAGSSGAGSGASSPGFEGTAPTPGETSLCNFGCSVAPPPAADGVPAEDIVCPPWPCGGVPLPPVSGGRMPLTDDAPPVAEPCPLPCGPLPLPPTGAEPGVVEPQFEARAKETLIAQACPAPCYPAQIDGSGSVPPCLPPDCSVSSDGVVACPVPPPTTCLAPEGVGGDCGPCSTGSPACLRCVESPNEAHCKPLPPDCAVSSDGGITCPGSSPAQ